MRGYGNGNFGGKFGGRPPPRPFAAPRYAGPAHANPQLQPAVNPFTQVTDQFYDAVASMKALGEMAQMGMAMSAQFPPPQGAAQSAAAPPAKAPEAAAEPAARELAEALVTVAKHGQPVAKSGSVQDTKLTQHVKRLAELAGLGGAAETDAEKFERSLEASSAFKRLRSQVDTVQEDLASQKKKLHKIETVVQESGADIRDVKSMLVRLAGGPAPAGAAAAAAQPPPGPGPVGPRALFQPLVTPEVHDAAMPKLGFSPNRREMVDLRTEVAAGPMPFRQWADTVQRLKSVDQWRQKVNATTAGSVDASQWTKEQVLDGFYEHVDTQVYYIALLASPYIGMFCSIVENGVQAVVLAGLAVFARPEETPNSMLEVGVSSPSQDTPTAVEENQRYDADPATDKRYDADPAADQRYDADPATEHPGPGKADPLPDQMGDWPGVEGAADGSRGTLPEHRRILPQGSMAGGVDAPDGGHYDEVMGIVREMFHQSAHALAFGSAAPAQLAHPAAIIAVLACRRLVRGARQPLTG